MMKMTTLAMDAGALLGDAGMTVLIGFVVVFAVLLLLTWIFILFGKAGSLFAKGAQKSEEPSPAPKSATVPPVSVPTKKAPVVQAGISDEVVAAIAAAVAMMSADGKTYAVRRISRASGGRSAWAAAGIADNTRSF